MPGVPVATPTARALTDMDTARLGIGTVQFADSGSACQPQTIDSRVRARLREELRSGQPGGSRERGGNPRDHADDDQCRPLERGRGVRERRNGGEHDRLVGKRAA
jgi:hypothetical protein